MQNEIAVQIIQFLLDNIELPFEVFLCLGKRNTLITAAPFPNALVQRFIVSFAFVMILGDEKQSLPYLLPIAFFSQGARKQSPSIVIRRQGIVFLLIFGKQVARNFVQINIARMVACTIGCTQ